MALVRNTLGLALSPSFTAPLGLALAFGPAGLRERLLNVLGKVLSAENIERFITTLKWLTVLGSIKNINYKLNQWALNNWKWSPDTKNWDWKREVAVVTGGCSGIGLETVKQLMRKGVKVAVFDVQPAPKDIDGCRCIA
jgi:all-trans-retinol dehydrogenase (NAD+)